MDIIIRSDCNFETYIVRISGRFDLAAGSALRQELDAIFKPGINLHLNLQEIEFINSSGLGSLVSIMKEIRLLKGRFTLSDLKGYVMEIFELTQLCHIFEIFETEQDALESYL